MTTMLFTDHALPPWALISAQRALPIALFAYLHTYGTYNQCTYTTHLYTTQYTHANVSTSSFNYIHTYLPACNSSRPQLIVMDPLVRINRGEEACPSQSALYAHCTYAPFSG